MRRIGVGASNRIGHAVQVARACGRLAGNVRRTPVTVHGTALLKREDLQIAESFKMRGAANFVLTAPAAARARGVVCASSGNAGRALLLSARSHRIPVHVFVPAAADEVKVGLLEGLGAYVIRVSGPFAQVGAAAKDFAAARRMLYCSSASSREFIYGIATLGVEFLDQVGPVDNVLVPIGGGGLAVGVGVALSLLPRRRRPALIGVELAVSCPVRQYLAPGSATALAGTSIADCLFGGLEAEAAILDVAADILDDVVVVSDEQLTAAQAGLRQIGIEVAAGPAAAFAGYRALAGRLKGRRSGLVISGAR